MSADQLVSYLTYIIYTLIFIQVVRQAIQSPSRSTINIALLFALPTLIIAIGLAADLSLVEPGWLTNSVNTTVLLALAYVLLRLVDDFAPVPAWLSRGSGVLLVLLSASTFLTNLPRPAWHLLAIMLYFVGLQIYGAIEFARQSRLSRGVTQRRLVMAALGSLFLGLVVISSVVRTALPALNPVMALLVQSAALASAISFFVGFSPPSVLRRAWQEPELRAFLGRAASLPRLSTTEAIVAELERGAAASTGAANAAVGLWDPDSRQLTFGFGEQRQLHTPTLDTPGGRAFLKQEAALGDFIVYERSPRDPSVRPNEVLAVVAAPITAGEKQLGILSVYGRHAPIFAEDDLTLVQLLADQAAVILESRALIDEASRVRAREEATRLKDDFLSAAAHDLKTPLTTILGQSQLMKRRAERNPGGAVDVAGLERISTEAQRLAHLVNDLLDASRAEEGKLLSEQSQVNLTQLAHESCQRLTSERNPILLDSPRQLIVQGDAVRLTQMLDNLLENAIKYSPMGGEIRMSLQEEGGQALLAIRDRGIGVPAVDLPHLFDRFFRAGNVDDRRFSGMGLGLYICRAIVEAHGGHIWATSEPDQGSTFHVSLPNLVSAELQGSNGRGPQVASRSTPSNMTS